MTTKVSARDVVTTLSGFENTIRKELGHSASSGEVLTAIDQFLSALSEISKKNGASDQIICISDQIICGNKNGNG